MNKKEFLETLRELGFNQNKFAKYVGRTEDSLKKWNDKNIPTWAIIIVRLLEENKDYKDFFDSHMKIKELEKKYT